MFYFMLLAIEVAVVSIGAAVHRYLAKHHARDRENVPDWQRLTFWTTTATLSIVFFIMMTVMFDFGYANGLIYIFGNPDSLRTALNILIVGIALAVLVILFDLISPNNGFRRWFGRLRIRNRSAEETTDNSSGERTSSNTEDREKDYELFVRTVCYILLFLNMIFTLAASILPSGDAGTGLPSVGLVIQTMLTACTFAILPISIRQVIYYLRNMKRLSRLDDDEETRRLYVKNFINKENTKL